MKFFNNYGLKSRNIPLIYFPRFIGGFIFFLPILALYYKRTLGTISDVALLFAVQAFAAFLFEIPTGAIADLFGRKNTFSLAFFVYIIGLIFLYIGGTFWMFLVSVIFISLANSLASGTDNALIYDTLKSEGKEKYYKKIIGRYGSLWPFGASIAALVGGYLASISLQLTVVVTFVPIAIAFVLTLFLEEPKYEKAGHYNVLRHMKESLSLVVKTRQLKILMFSAFILFGLGESLYQLTPIFFEFKGIPIISFGVFYALIHVFSATGFFYSHEFSEKFGNKRLLIGALFFGVLVDVLATQFNGYFAALLLVSSSLFFGLRWPLIDHFLNQEVESAKRATVFSTHQFMSHIGIACIVPFIGYYAELYTVNTAFLVGSLMMFSVVILFMFLEEK